MATPIAKSHNQTLLMYHIVCPARYRRKVFSTEVVRTLRDVCEGIQKRYEIHFIEIGADDDHVHFLVQSVPTMAENSTLNRTNIRGSLEPYAPQKT